MENLASVVEVVEKIDHARTISLMRNMIRIPTENPPGNEEPLCFFIKDVCEKLGLKTEVVYFHEKRPSLFAKLNDARDEPHFIFLHGHLDTVPCGNLDAWSVDPYKGVIKDGKIYGRGTCDMKGALACMLTAIETVINNTDRLNRNWAFIAVSDEEDLGRGTKSLISHGLLNNAIFGIFCEPTDLQIVTAHRGNVWLEVEAKGIAAHGSIPGIGRNAILAVCDFLNKLEGIKWEPDISINVGTIEGGVKINMVPDFCKVSLDIRYPSKTNPELLIYKIKQVLSETSRENHYLDVKFSVKKLQSRPPINIPPTLPIIQKVITIVSTILRRKALPTAMPYTTDASIFVQSMNAPVIILGPGKPAVAHTADEHVELEKLKVATEVYTALMLAL